MEKKRIIITVVSVLILIICCVVLMIVDKNNAYDIENKSYIFETMSDLDFLNDNEIIEIDDKHKIDSIIGRSVKVKYENKYFNVYAYEFESKEQAWVYAEKISGTDYSSFYEMIKSTNFYYTKTVNILAIYQNRLTMVISENKVLHISSHCNSKKYAKFLNYLFIRLPLRVEYKF